MFTCCNQVEASSFYYYELFSDRALCHGFLVILYFIMQPKCKVLHYKLRSMWITLFRHLALMFLDRFFARCQMSSPCFTPDVSFFMNARIDRLPSVVTDLKSEPNSSLALLNRVINASFSAITAEVVLAVCSVRLYNTCPVSWSKKSSTYGWSLVSTLYFSLDFPIFNLGVTCSVDKFE